MLRARCVLTGRLGADGMSSHAADESRGAAPRWGYAPQTRGTFSGRCDRGGLLEDHTVQTVLMRASRTRLRGVGLLWDHTVQTVQTVLSARQLHEAASRVCSRITPSRQSRRF